MNGSYRELGQGKGQLIFVSRHPGASEWATEMGLQIDLHVKHLLVDQVTDGDVVIGTLPVNLIALLTQRGVRYFHLTLDMPPEMRGQELSSRDLRICQARLEEFRAYRIEGNEALREMK